MFKILTPNEFYNGTTMSVKFVDGIGETDNEEVKNILVNDFGYKVVNKKQEEPKKVNKSPKKVGE